MNPGFDLNGNLDVAHAVAQVRNRDLVDLGQVFHAGESRIVVDLDHSAVANVDLRGLAELPNRCTVDLEQGSRLVLQRDP